MAGIPLVNSNGVDDINTSIIAIKKEINSVGNTEVNVTLNMPENSIPVDTVASGDMHAVTSNAVSRAMSYSTEEHKTGKKWINGKDIYSKTYYNVSNFPHSAGLTNVDEITKIDAIAIDVNSNFYPLPFVTVISGVTYFTNVYYNKNNNAIYSDSNSNIEGVNVTLEYTKTTD